MPNWTQSMSRTFEFYEVDPKTWMDLKKIDNITDATINWDFESDTLGSATIDTTGLLGEMYIRIYMITEQDRRVDKRPLATVLAQTPSFGFDGRVRTSTLDAYTPLIELKENQPPLGYSVRKGSNILQVATHLIQEHARAPVVAAYSDETLDRDFVSKPDDTWFTFISDLIRIAKHRFGLDTLGRILFEPLISLDEMTPRYTYSDDANSIIRPEVQLNRDIFGIPNKVEVIYTGGGEFMTSIATNDDPNSPTSIAARGRIISRRITDPQLSGKVTQDEVDIYAKTLLIRASSIEGNIQYEHAWCETRLGDCVMLNYERAGLVNVKAFILSQTIHCSADCSVQENAQFKLSVPVNSIGTSNRKIKVQDVVVVPGANEFVLNPSEGFKYIRSVTIVPITALYSPNKIGKKVNIPTDGITYSGTTYTVDDKVYKTQERTYQPTQYDFTLKPDAGVDYFTQVIIKPIGVSRSSYNGGTAVYIGKEET